MPCYSKTDLNKRNSSAHRKEAKDVLTHVPLQSGTWVRNAKKITEGLPFPIKS